MLVIARKSFERHLFEDSMTRSSYKTSICPHQAILIPLQGQGLFNTVSLHHTEGLGQNLMTPVAQADEAVLSIKSVSPETLLPRLNEHIANPDG